MRGPALAAAAVVGLWAGGTVPVSAAGPVQPDLVLPKESVGWDREAVRLLVRNDGDGHAPATMLEVRDRPWLGVMDLESSDVQLRPPGSHEDVLQREVPALAPGDSAWVKFYFAPTSGELFAYVDPADAVSEAREGNNVTSVRRDPEFTQAALHVHSCLSEGPGSFDWQVLHAALSGYDLIWWTEHDWRTGCYDHIERVDLDGGRHVWVRASSEEGAIEPPEVRWVDPGPREGLRSVEIRDGEAVKLGSARDRLAYSLASGVTVRLGLQGEFTDPAAAATVRFVLSKHPNERHELAYDLVRGGASSSLEARQRSLEPGSWQEIVFSLSDDAKDTWAIGFDNNLMSIELESTPGVTVRVATLAVEHERCGEDLLRAQREWTEAYPNVAHEVGGEISYKRPHLTRYGGPDSAFSLDTTWESTIARPLADATERITRAQSEGAVVGWCHPFGTAKERRRPNLFDERYWRQMIEGRLGGANLLEVGYRDRAGFALRDYLERWDAASAAGLVITGVGVNDSHHVQWGPGENNFATWIQAPASDPDAILRALTRGYVSFGDPLEFRGTLTLRSEDLRGGDVRGGEGPRAFEARYVGGLPSHELRILVDGEPVATEPRGDYGVAVELSPGEGRWVRAELWSEEGAPLRFTNPIYLDADGTLERRGR